MDQYTSDLLIKWGLLEYVSVFAAARIDSMTLEMLEPNDVAQLINPIGDQLRFKANLEVWKKEMVVAGQNRNVTADVNETPLDSSFMGRLLRDLDNPSENCSPSTSIQRDSSCLAPESDNIENEVILILQKTLEGRAILAKGQHNNGLLNLELRKELANLIIRDKLQADPNKLLSGPSLLKISHQIATIFPQESPVHFYAPYLRATEFQTKRNASGILYNAYSTRKRHLRSLGALPASKRSTSRRQSTNSDTKRTIPSGIIFEGEHSTVEVAELLKNLEHPDPGPWQTIEQTWTSTLSARIHFLYQEKGTLADYLNRFPILKSPSGYHLLLQDFQKLYPEKCDGMTVFSNSTKRIIELAISKVKQTKDIYLKRTIEDYIGSIDANKEESELNVSLLLLPFIINISPVRRKDSWKASRSEVRDGFITHVPTDREILVALAERREKLAKVGATLQPLVIYCGESIQKITKVYVVCENTLYEFPSLSKGVDGAFKIFHSTATEYPKESYDIWILLQLAFYDIQTDFDRPTAAVKQLMVDLHFKEKVK